jgi:putative SOS response-associated peptidase YedK
MCGRYGNSSTPAEFRQHLALSSGLAEYHPRYNIAPTQKAPVVKQEGVRRDMSLMRWGIQLPPKADGTKGPPIFNIRAETLLTNGLWKSRLLKARAVAPAGWFYEWVAVPGQKAKQPVLIRRRDGAPLAFAALVAKSDHEEGGEAYTLITTSTDGQPELQKIHHRWPVCLDPESIDVWLDPETRLEALAELLMPPSPSLFERYAVSELVNKVGNEGPRLAEPVSR